MNLFDQLVLQALENQPDLSTLRVVVEKELLHHDILRILNEHHMLEQLTFIGGTCLRSCYGGIRLSEDLDFTGGADFTREQLSTMGRILTKQLQEKYNFPVSVSEPMIDKQNVDTWKIKIRTRPEKKHFPAQQINIDICAIHSYEQQPMMLLNPYGVDMGTSGLILQAQSREEIYADKLLAFALRPNRIKHRDLWDILWMHQQSIKPRLTLIPQKLADRHLQLHEFMNLFNTRLTSLTTNSALAIEFNQEMQRFLPVAQLNQIMQNNNLWKVITHLMQETEKSINMLMG